MCWCHYEEIGHSTSHKIVKNSVHDTFRIGANFYIDYNVNASNAGANRFVETCYKQSVHNIYHYGEID